MRRTFTQSSLSIGHLKAVARPLVFLLLAVTGLRAQAQTIITTTGTTYDAANTSGAPGAITFAINNSNTTGALLTGVGTYRKTTDPALQVFTLWYHPTQLTGAPTIDAINGWIQIAQSTPLAVPATNGIQNVITGLSFYVPPTTSYRFALTVSAGNIHYSGSTAAPATPNSHTVAGSNIDLLVGNNAASPGYAGVVPSPAIPDAAFTGRVIFAAPCAGTPLAGNLSPGGVVSFCSGQSFTITRFGGTQASGLTYQWEQAEPGSAGWINAVGGANANSPTYTTPVLTDTIYYRLRVTCASTGQSATTNPIAFNRANFYTCYCASSASSAGTFEDIGRVVIHEEASGGDTLLANGVGSPIANNTTAVNGYSNFQNPATAPVLYRDSLYRSFIQQISRTTNQSSMVAAWIDFDQNAVFNANELIFSRPTLVGATPQWSISDTFRIPSNAPVGLTGMRVVLAEGTAMPSACGTYLYGETEDYLVRIAYPLCDGPADAGIAAISDTLLCQNHPFLLVDSSYERQRSGLQRVWEMNSSIGGGAAVWTVVPNSANKDTLNRLFVAPALYRLRLVCTGTSDTTYSNVVSAGIDSPYACYCYSSTPGFPTGPQDSTDIGAFRLGNFYVTPPGGPHLQNPMAVRGRSNHTRLGVIELKADSSYVVNVYQVIRSAIHRDAKITMFIDYNVSGTYDAPRERVLTGFTTANNWYFIDSITIPDDSMIFNTRTGMRVIINDNINPNTPSDNGCGTYTSGETEDYVVILRDQFFSGVNTVNSVLHGMVLSPNPTAGRTTVTLRTSSGAGPAQLTVSDLTGRTLTRQSLNTSAGDLQAEIDLSGQPRGVYFVEVRAAGERLVKKLVVR